MTEQVTASAADRRLRELVDRWRAEGARCDSFHATMGVGYKACADQLEKELAVRDAPPRGPLIRWPELRDSGKPNHWHEFDQDPETQMCVICGWAEAVHVDAPPRGPLEEAPCCEEHGAMVADDEIGSSWHCAVCDTVFPAPAPPRGALEDDRAMEPDQAKQCGRPQVPDRWSYECTRTKDHAGSHVAHGHNGEELASWEWNVAPRSAGSHETPKC